MADTDIVAALRRCAQDTVEYRATNPHDAPQAQADASLLRKLADWMEVPVIGGHRSRAELIAHRIAEGESDADDQ